MEEEGLRCGEIFGLEEVVMRVNYICFCYLVFSIHF